MTAAPWIMVDDVDELERDLRRVRAVAQVMDAQFAVGRVRFGADAILGLVPGVGDAVALGVGLYPILVAAKHRLGAGVILRMAGNLALDLVVGAVPLAGDLIDVAFKANLRNVALLERAARYTARCRRVSPATA